MACVTLREQTWEAEAEAEERESKRARKEEAGVYSDTNKMPIFEGRTTHVGLAAGELANRVVVVGSPGRAELLSQFLQPEEPGKGLFMLASDRGFTTYTGTFQGKRLSVVSIGMGLAMMDFFVRETRAMVEGPMAVVRLGTCGFLRKAVTPGTISVASEGSVLVQRNYAAFAEGAPPKGTEPYLISPPCPADAELTAAVSRELKEELGAESVVEGLNATADSFYSSQGRWDQHFPDANEELSEELRRRHPNVLSMEMESFMLFHLAQQCRPAGSLRAAAAAVNVANRETGEVVGAEKLQAMERNGGKALLKALVSLEL